MPGAPLYPRMSPSDAVVALRSLPRRFRALFATPGDEHEEERLAARRPTPSSWSAVEHVNHVSDVLDHADRQLEHVLVEPVPVVEDHPPTAPARTSLADALARLGTSAERLATRASRAGAHDWGRTASIPNGGSVTALGVVRAAVERAVLALRAVEEVLDQVRGRTDLDPS